VAYPLKLFRVSSKNIEGRSLYPSITASKYYLICFECFEKEIELTFPKIAS